MSLWCRHHGDDDAERFLRQISRVRDRLRLIGIIQSCAAMAFVLALTAMIATYFDEPTIASIMFLCSISLLIISMLLFTREIQIANTALDVHLSDLETHQEWQQYLKPKRKRRNTTSGTSRNIRQLSKRRVKPEHIKTQLSGNRGFHV